MVKKLSARARRTRVQQQQFHSRQQQHNNGGSSSLLTFNNMIKLFFAALLALMGLVCMQYLDHMKEENEIQKIIQSAVKNPNTNENYAAASSSSAFLDKVETKLSNTKIRSGKVEPVASQTSTTAVDDNNNDDNPFPKSISRSKLLTCDDYKLSSSSSSLSSFLSQSRAKEIINTYATEIVAISQKPRFVPVLLELMKAAAGTDNVILSTVQLGGMDGYTGDPFYRMTQLYKDPLTHWLPVVVEPVPQNFEKLIGTYQDHKTNRQLPCGHLLRQLVNYDEAQEEGDQKGICGFCHFDETSTKCDHLPSWQKYEIGSMDCDRKQLPECFIRSEFYCGKIGEALEHVHIHPSQVVVLQIDVEGFEKYTLEGYFSELSSPEEYPPVINFENKILKGRKQLQPLYDFLKSKGYSLHEKRTDTLCLLGYKGGDTFIDKK